jgi:HEAT repeat protein
MSHVARIVVALVYACGLSPVVGEDLVPLEYLKHRDPLLKVEISTERKISPRLVPLWRESLALEDSELQRRIAVDVADAWRQGFAEVKQAEPELRAVLKRTGIHPISRLAVAQALFAIGAKDATAELFEYASQADLDVRIQLEPQFGGWKHAPMIEAWRARLSDEMCERRDLMLAIHGLREAGESGAAEALTKIALASSRPVDVRLAAARAAGSVVESGLESSARGLLEGSPSTVAKLVAVGLLRRHRSAETIAIVASLATDPEPSVASPALQVLFDIGPVEAWKYADFGLVNPDANVRRVLIEAGLAIASPETIERLGPLLNDPHPGLRRRIREEVVRLAGTESLTSTIHQQGHKLLGGDDWRGQEQAAFLLASLDQKTASTRLVELLESTRPEVTIAAAWSLRVLAVPETLPAILDRMRRVTDVRLGTTKNGPTLEMKTFEAHVAHLSETFGAMKYEPAAGLLAEYVPKNFALGDESRAAAIWALGKIYDGEKKPDLSGAMVGRLNDGAGMPPEVSVVRQYSAISIGRLGVESDSGALKKLLGEDYAPDPIELSMNWALEKLTGEAVPAAKWKTPFATGWNLEPRDPPESPMAPGK